MFRPSAAPPSPRRLSPWRRAAFFGAGLLALWLALQLAPAGPPTPPPDPVAASDRLPPVTATTEAGGRLGTVETRPERGLLRPGNVLAVFILAGGIVLAFVLRRRGEGRPTAEGVMATLDAHALAPGAEIRLVRVGEEVLLLGLAQGGVSLLRRYRADEAPVPLDAPMIPGPAAPSSGAAEFAALLRHAQTPPTRG